MKAAPGSNFFAAAPTRDQAKSIYWNDLKKMTPAWIIFRVRESELRIELTNGNMIAVIGMDRPERIEGTPWDGGILDEYANMKEEAWGQNVRPALSTPGRRPGWCWLIGVPEGRNHYYERWLHARSGADPEWDGFTWFSSVVMDQYEVDQARKDLDELTFQQEYEASFVNFQGQAYYPFREEVHCARLRHLYRKTAPIAFCFDFNVDPGIAVVVQELNLPVPRTPVIAMAGDRPLFKNVEPDPTPGTAVIGEVHIPTNSNTVAVCNKLIADWGDHVGPIGIYGDATGGNRGTAKIEGSDWDLVKNAMYAHFGNDQIFYQVDDSNPTERSRVNAVNTRLRTQDGSVQLMIDPAHAPMTVRDFEGVRLLEGGSGEIDKKHDQTLTHLTDGVGYYIAKRYPVRPHVARSTPLRI